MVRANITTNPYLIMTINYYRLKTISFLLIRILGLVDCNITYFPIILSTY
nr:MAG TPA: hypothetical protein [Caudoviricetes sp.]DAW55649.1 MAG TPA: hypothetical protein [Caudoviricetes sp.]